MSPAVPPYFDLLLEGFRQGTMSRFVHLGHFEEPPASARPGEFARAQARLNDILLDLAELHHGHCVLDVGCGLGGTLESINARFQSLTLVGVNIDPRQLAVCQELVPRPSNRCAWVEADACRLPLPAESVDRILCVEAMFHFPSRRTFLHEAARVLRPGGILVASDMLLAESARQLDIPGFCIEAAVADGYGPWPDFWGDDADLPALGSAAGLVCTRLVDATASTLPSHRFTVPPHADERRDPGDAILRAAIMLRWLHSRGHLRYLYLRFDKPL